MSTGTSDAHRTSRHTTRRNEHQRNCVEEVRSRKFEVSARHLAILALKAAEPRERTTVGVIRQSTKPERKNQYSRGRYALQVVVFFQFPAKDGDNPNSAHRRSTSHNKEPKRRMSVCGDCLDLQRCWLTQGKYALSYRKPEAARSNERGRNQTDPDDHRMPSKTCIAQDASVFIQNTPQLYHVLLALRSKPTPMNDVLLPQVPYAQTRGALLYVQPGKTRINYTGGRLACWPGAFLDSRGLVCLIRMYAHTEANPHWT